MSEPNDPPIPPDTVACEICMKEIPASEALSPEAHEYVLYFCGGDCRAVWEDEKAAEIEQLFEERSGVSRE